MKKAKLISSILVSILSTSIILVGCQTQKEVDSNNSLRDSENATIEEKQDEAEIIYGENGLPPLNDELMNFYKKAYEFYEKYYMCGFQMDHNTMKVVNGLTYYKVNEEQFSTLKELEDNIKLYFTGTTLNNILSEIDYYFIEEDNTLYGLDFGSSANLFYSGHIFQLISQNDKVIELKLIRYMAKEQEDITKEKFYEIPVDLGRYDIEEFPLVLEKEEEAWKISEIRLIYK